MTKGERSNNFVFAYWEGDDRRPIAEMMEAWQSAFPGFRVLNDTDVLSLLEALEPEFVTTYRRIRIPAAKADVARLLGLYRFGGMYVDCHCGIANFDMICALFKRLGSVDNIFVDRVLTFVPRHPEEHYLLNCIMLSCPGSAHMLEMARQAMANLAWQRRIEAQEGFTKYSLINLCGPGLVTSMTLQAGTCNRDVRHDLAARTVIIHEEEFPVLRNRYNSYRAPGVHLSERQTIELLFAH